MLGVKQLHGMCVMSNIPDFLQNMASLVEARQTYSSGNYRHHCMHNVTKTFALVDKIKESWLSMVEIIQHKITVDV